MALVSKVIGDCPRCGLKGGFGNVSVAGDHVLRGCKRCVYKKRISLPPVQKKVVYLDQSLLSAAFRDSDPAAVGLVERVKSLALDQLLVAPYSSVHEDETHLLQNSKPEVVGELMDFIKRTAGGCEFNPAYKVEHNQVFDAYRRFRAGEEAIYDHQRDNQIVGDADEWQDYFYVDVPGYLGDPKENEKSKAEAVDALLDALDIWRDNPLPFSEIIRLEYASAFRVYMGAFGAYFERMMAGDLSALLDAPLNSQVIQGLLGRGDEEELVARLGTLSAFFNSAYFFECPYHWISVRIFAVLRDQVQNGAFQDREKAKIKLRGVFHDVGHIATYAPYCDAMFVDNAMAHILHDPRLRLSERYGTRIFSARSRADFDQWLSGVSASMTDLHRAGLKLAYPERQA